MAADGVLGSKSELAGKVGAELLTGESTTKVSEQLCPQRLPAGSDQGPGSQPPLLS